MSARNEGHDSPHMSHSQVAMWQRCPKQFEYRYEKGIKRPPSVVMASGTSVHNTLEANNLWKIDTGEDMEMGRLLDIASDSHDKAMMDAEEEQPGEKGRTKDENIEIARFYRRVQAPHIIPIQAEQTFTIVIPDDEHGAYLPVIGYMDVKQMVPDPALDGMTLPTVLALEDYKRINRNRKTQADADLSIQLTLYDYATHLAQEPLPQVIGLRNVGFNPPKTRALDGPGPYTRAVYRSPHLLEPGARQRKWERTLTTVRQVQRLIKTGDFPPTDDPRTCVSCGYLDICQETPLKE
jgi:CRISPR/Cas system-associated exonuclease Cas4 (RecB family)